MKELTERDKALIVDSRIGANTRLFLASLQGRGGKWLDRSIYANDGTITGPTWTRLPSGLLVLTFNGTSDFVTCGAPASLNITTSLSVRAWIKIAALGPGYVLAKDANVGGRAFSYGVNDTPVLMAKQGSGMADWNATGGTTLALNTWYLGGWVYDSDAATGQYYLNGVADGTATSVAAPASSTVATTIGKGSYPGYNYWLGGKIALPQLDAEVISAAEMLRCYKRERHLFGV